MSTATAQEAALKRIQFPALSWWQILAFVIHVTLWLPFHAPVFSILEALLILGFYFPSAFLYDLIIDRTRSNRPVRDSYFQQAVLKITQTAFAFFDYRLGRAVFSDEASLALMQHRWASKALFDVVCQKTTVRVDGKHTVTGWWLGTPGKAKHMIERDAPKARKYPVLMFLCGGGFVMARPSFYLEFLHKLRITLSHSHPQYSDIVVFAPEYPLAPEHAHPAQAEAARLAWQYLSSHPSVDTQHIIVCGDSAGANLALGLRMAIANADKPQFEAYRGLPPPSQMVLLSPFTELDVPAVHPEGSSMKRNAPYDFVDSSNIGFFAQLYTGVSKPAEQPAGLISFLRRKTLLALLYPLPAPAETKSRTPAEQDHAALCRSDALLSPGSHVTELLRNHPQRVPTLIVYGKGEVLADQSRRLADALGDEAEELTAPSVHAWPIVLFHLGRDGAERGSGVLRIGSWLATHCKN